MSQLLDLSPELLLTVADHLAQVDLLNVSLTCSYLREATKGQLFREYVQISQRGQSLEKFIRRILGDRSIENYVRRVRLETGDALEDLAGGRRPWLTARKSRARLMYEEKYDFFTKAAKSSGLIATITPYSRIATLLYRMENHQPREERGFGEILTALDFNKFSADELFCHALGYQIDQAFVILLLSLLPNLREIHLSSFQTSLPLAWSSDVLKFPKLKLLSASAGAGPAMLPLAFFKQQIENGSLKTLQMLSTSSWWGKGLKSHDGGHLHAPLSFISKSLNISRIVLESSSLSRSDMEMLLNACHSLKTLWYSAGGRITGPANFTAYDLIDMLRSNKETLETLTLDMTTEWSYDQDEENIESLLELTSLESLDIIGADLDAMLQCEFIEDAIDYNDVNPPDYEVSDDELLRNRLPRSLRRLVIRDLEGMAELSIPQLRGLIPTQKAQSSCLELVTVVSDTHERYAPLERSPLPGCSPFSLRVLASKDCVAECAFPIHRMDDLKRPSELQIEWDVEDCKYTVVAQDENNPEQYPSVLRYQQNTI